MGSTKSARASAMRMRQPPEKSRVRFACIVFVKPSPCSSCAARASVVDASSASSLRLLPRDAAVSAARIQAWHVPHAQVDLPTLEGR